MRHCIERWITCCWGAEVLTTLQLRYPSLNIINHMSKSPWSTPNIRPFFGIIVSKSGGTTWNHRKGSTFPMDIPWKAHGFRGAPIENWSCGSPRGRGSQMMDSENGWEWFTFFNLLTFFNQYVIIDGGKKWQTICNLFISIHFFKVLICAYMCSSWKSSQNI